MKTSMRHRATGRMLRLKWHIIAGFPPATPTLTVEPAAKGHVLAQNTCLSTILHIREHNSKELMIKAAIALRYLESKVHQCLAHTSIAGREQTPATPCANLSGSVKAKPNPFQCPKPCQSLHHDIRFRTCH